MLVQSGNQIEGYSTGNVGYDVVYQDSLTTSLYEVTFVKNTSSEVYQMYWSMENITTGKPWIDKMDLLTKSLQVPF